MIFSDYIRNKRLEREFTLREFCRIKGQDSAYISRLENNLISPPKSVESLKALAKAYEIEEKTEEWVTFFDLASARQNAIPENITSNNPNVLHFLPAFYRTIRKKDVSEQDIKKLLDLMQGEVDGNSEEDRRQVD